MRILLTNDDGIDSVGLHVLATAMKPFGDIVIVAPDSEYSGAGAAIGAIWNMRPECERRNLEGFDEAWAVSGPPALCVMFARMGAFGPVPDLIVSGINPGANVGRSVYHSGTIGATLTGRNGGISGVAVSQSVRDFGVEGQAWEESIKGLHWESAAAVAAAAVEGMIAAPPEQPSVLNINVPDLPLDQLGRWEWTTVGEVPPRALSEATLSPKTGHTDRFHVDMSYGDATDQPEGTDTAAMQDGHVSLTWLSRLSAMDQPAPAVDKAVDALMGLS
jgi:5'-nucleotidase